MKGKLATEEELEKMKGAKSSSKSSSKKQGTAKEKPKETKPPTLVHPHDKVRPDAAIPAGTKANPASKRSSTRGKGLGVITPQRLQVLMMAYQAGNTSDLVKKQIIAGLNKMVKDKVLTKTQAKKFRSKNLNE